MLRPKPPVVKYRYHDTPDGEDIDKKLKAVLKPTIMAALGISTSDVMVYSNPKGYMRTLGRYAWYTFPMVGISAAFVVTTNFLCNYRKKDDKVNWTVGGAVAGGIFGAWRGGGVVITSSVLVFGLMALMKKHANENGYMICPDKFTPPAMSLWDCHHDYTLTKDNPGAWKIPELRNK